MTKTCSQCGNTLGAPRVSPYPITYVDAIKRKTVELLYMAGFVDDLCWFCKFPR